LDSLFTRLRSQFRLSTVSSLQLFQLARYLGFVLIGISFAKLGIPKEQIGRFESFLWLMGLFSFFWIAGLMNSMLAIYPKHTPEDKKKLLFTTFCLILLLSAVAGVVQFFVGGSILGLAYLLFNNASYVVEYILFLSNRRRQLITYGIVVAVIQVLLSVGPAYIYGDTQYAIYGLVVVAVIKFIYIVSLLRSHTTVIYERSRITELLILSLPLMVSFFVNGSAEYIDGAVVRHYFTLSDFSVFRYGSREFPLFTILAATLSMSMIPRVSENVSDGLAAIRKESLRYMHVFFPLAIILALSSRWLFSVFFSPQFEQSGRVFAALMLLTIPRLLFPQTILTALKENRIILLCSIFEVSVNIIASVILARYYGLVGVAYGTVIAFTAEKSLMATILYSKHKIIFTDYVAVIPFIIYSLMTCISYMLSLHL
jgi:O-antigen/teichoic acid export membrane protein